MRKRSLCMVAGVYLSFPGSAFCQAVSFADLQGFVIHTLVRYQQVGTRNGQPFKNQSETDQTIAIDSDHSAQLTTVFRNSAGQSSPMRSGSFTLGKPFEVNGPLQGHQLWVFDDGQLVHIQTFKGGGWRTTITITRKRDKGFDCAVRSVAHKEEGVEGWNWTSPIVGGDIRMQSITAIESRCEISRR